MALVQIRSHRRSLGERFGAWRSPRVLRQAVMLFFFLFLLHVAVEHQWKGGGPNGAPSIEAYCPFGGLEGLYQFVVTGGFVRHIEPSALLIFAAVLLLTLLFSRGFCGWICPFGSLQEWLGLLGRRLFGRRYNPDSPWARRLGWAKYGVLGLIIFFTWRQGVLVFRPYDPFLAFFHLGKGFNEMPWAYGALGLVVLGSLKYERFFCRFACPLGAALGLAGKLGLTKVQRDEAGCKGCNICQKRCFVHIDFLKTTRINSAECNHCLDCVVECPRPNVLALRGGRWRFGHGAYAALLVVGLLGLIGTSQLWGKWRTLPEKVSYTNKAGRLDAGQIRGWMTLGEVSQGYGLPLERLYPAAGVPAGVPPQTRLNKIGEVAGVRFEADSVREAVERELAGAPAAQKKDHPTEEVRGTMSLKEIQAKTGVTPAFVLKRLGIRGVSETTPVREWLHAHDKSMQDVREAIAAWRAGAR